jgi:hypothetical protein
MPCFSSVTDQCVGRYDRAYATFLRASIAHTKVLVVQADALQLLATQVGLACVRGRLCSKASKASKVDKLIR